MFNVLVDIFLRTDPTVFKKYETFPDGDLYIVNSQMFEEKLCNFTEKFLCLAQYRIHFYQWMYIVEFHRQRYFHLHFSVIVYKNKILGYRNQNFHNLFQYCLDDVR